MFYAIVFRRSFAPGEHWSDVLPEPGPGEKRVPGRHRVHPEDPDRKQSWAAGELYSTGTVIRGLPAHLEAVEFSEVPPADWVWDAASRQFVAP